VQAPPASFLSLFPGHNTISGFKTSPRAQFLCWSEALNPQHIPVLLRFKASPRPTLSPIEGFETPSKDPLPETAVDQAAPYIVLVLQPGTFIRHTFYQILRDLFHTHVGQMGAYRIDVEIAGKV